MKGSTASFLQGVVALIGLGVLFLLLWEPHLEGRNAQATVFEIYFKDPFLAFAYVGSVPFFVAVYRAFGLLGDFRRNQGFSRETVNGLRVIKRCALTVIGFVAVALGIILMLGDGEDRPGGVFMCLLVTLAAGSTAAAAAVLGRKVQNTLRS